MTTERLQAAIAKARKQRDERGQTGPAPASARPKEAPASTGWDALPQTPLDTQTLIRNRILSVDSSRESTPFDILRTRIAQRMRENGWKRIALTSPTPRCGKSTMTLNLAFGLSRQPDRRIISIESDMRRPSHESLLGLTSRDRSVTRLLQGVEPFEKSAVVAKPNLAFAVNSRTTSNASDVLLGDTVGVTLKALDANYAPDITLFDTPPLLINDDTMAFLSHVDCALIVAAAGDTTIKEIDQCERLIAQETQVMGVVLNKSRHVGSTAGYDYY